MTSHYGGGANLQDQGTFTGPDFAAGRGSDMKLENLRDQAGAKSRSDYRKKNP